MSQGHQIQRDQIWLFEPDPAVGREQMGIRPGVIVSSNHFHQGDRELVVVVPLSTRQRSVELYPMHIELTPEMSGLRVTSYAMCEQIRSVSIERIYGRRPRGELNQLAMLAVEHRLRNLLEL